MNYRQVSTNGKKYLILSKEETDAIKVHYDIDRTKDPKMEHLSSDFWHQVTKSVCVSPHCSILPPASPSCLKFLTTSRRGEVII